VVAGTKIEDLIEAVMEWLAEVVVWTGKGNGGRLRKAHGVNS
jgi:hypothetical protein